MTFSILKSIYFHPYVFLVLVFILYDNFGISFFFLLWKESELNELPGYCLKIITIKYQLKIKLLYTAL